VAGGSVTDWLTAIGTVGTGVVAVVLAIWGNALRSVFYKPKLDSSVRMEAPYAHHLWREESGVRTEGYYFRIGVENRGNDSAREVEVRLISLKRKNAEGAFLPEPDFRPLNLRWSHVLKTVMPKIDRQLSKYCDLCHVWRKGEDLLMDLDTEVVPAEVRPLVWPTRKKAGTYRIAIAVSAANAEPRFADFEIDFKGVWFDEPEAMFKTGLTIRRTRRMYRPGRNPSGPDSAS